MKILLKKLSQIVPYDHNPRANDAAVEAVAASIRQFGFRQPIVVDSQFVIVVGHTRFKAAQLLALDKVPVVVADDLTPEQIQAYRIADNKTGELADWDLEMLAGELTQLNDSDFDMTLLGFDDRELAELLDFDAEATPAASSAASSDRVAASLAPARDSTEQPAQPLSGAQPPDGPVTRVGDLIELGKHRLLCCDARTSDGLERVMSAVGAGRHERVRVWLVERDPAACDLIARRWRRDGRGQGTGDSTTQTKPMTNDK